VLEEPLAGAVATGMLLVLAGLALLAVRPRAAAARVPPDL
jgi:hypothetical protein